MSKTEEFGKVLENDPKMKELKVRLEAMKDELVSVSCDSISRMRELMIEDGVPADDDDYSILVYALAKQTMQESIIRQMDILVPGWQEKAVESVTEALMKELMDNIVRH